MARKAVAITKKDIRRVLAIVRKGTPLHRACFETGVSIQLWYQTMRRDSEFRKEYESAQIQSRNARIKLQHGKFNGYNHYRCRCAECMQANRERARVYQGKIRPRGDCPVCHQQFSINMDQTIRRHGVYVGKASVYCAGSNTAV